MEESLEQQVAQRLNELPEDVRRAIESSDLPKHIQAIGSSHQLHIDQLGGLEDEVMLVLLGFEDPGNFTQNLVDHVQVPKDVAQKITDMVATEIFLPVRESMQSFMAARATADAAAAAPSAPVPAPNPAPAFPAADVALTQKTTTPPTPAPVPTQNTQVPKPYTNDPYHEPIQ